MRKRVSSGGANKYKVTPTATSDEADAVAVGGGGGGGMGLQREKSWFERRVRVEKALTWLRRKPPFIYAYN